MFFFFFLIINRPKAVDFVIQGYSWWELQTGKLVSHFGSTKRS